LKAKTIPSFAKWDIGGFDRTTMPIDNTESDTRPTKDDIPNPLSGWQEPRGMGIILFPVVFIN
jgi:hypothetical protein